MLLSKVCTSGKLIAIWLINDSDINIIKESNAASSIAAWSLPINVSNISLSASSPIAVINNNDDIVVVWSAYSSLNGLQNYFVATRPSGTGIWSSPVHLSTIGSVHNDARLSLHDNGNILVVWTAYTTPDETAVGVYTSSSNIATGIWATPIGIS